MRVKFETKQDGDTRLYFEAHITVSAEEIDTWPVFKRAAGKDWKVSRFDVDEVDDMSGMWFASARSRNLDDVIKMCSEASTRFVTNGFTVMRVKIEDTVFDTKHGDEMWPVTELDLSGYEQVADAPQPEGTAANENGATVGR